MTKTPLSCFSALRLQRGAYPDGYHSLQCLGECDTRQKGINWSTEKRQSHKNSETLERTCPPRRRIGRECTTTYLLVRMRPALMMVAMAVVSFVMILGLRIAFLAVSAAISVRRGGRAGTSLMGAYLGWRGRGICHTIKPLINQTTSLYLVFGNDPIYFDTPASCNPAGIHQGTKPGIYLVN